MSGKTFVRSGLLAVQGVGSGVSVFRWGMEAGAFALEEHLSDRCVRYHLQLTGSNHLYRSIQT